MRRKIDPRLSLEVLQELKLQILADRDEAALWLEMIASRFSSSEEQQRIVGDILEYEDRVKEIDAVIAARAGPANSK